MKAALYTRVSTEEQDAMGQVEQLRALCKARDWEVHKIYRDVQSGMDPARLAFNQLMHDARVGKFQVIVFWAWDRITRGGISPTFSIMERWRSWNVGWESLREPFLSSAADPNTAKLLLAIIAWLGEQERLRISERTKAGLNRRRALGVRLGRPPGSKDKRPRRPRNKGFPLWGPQVTEAEYGEG